MSVASGTPAQGAQGPELHVAMNLRRIHPIRSGIEAYIAGIVEGLDEIGGVRIHALGVSHREALPAGARDDALIRPQPAGRAGKVLFDLVRAGQLTADTPASVYHGVDGFLPLGLPARVRRVVTAYDLGFLRYPALFDHATRWLNTWHARTQLRRADCLLAISETTANDLMTLLGIPAGRIRVVWSGYSSFFVPAPHNAPAVAPYFLAVGGANPRKNLLRVLQAFAQWRRTAAPHRGMTLRVTGAVGNEFRSGLGDLAEQVTFEGFVTTTALRSLYQNASGLLFPALYEGFGIPILEAMASGSPVLTTNTGATAEVAGDAAILVDPLSIASIVNGMQQLVASGADLRRAGLTRASRFSWQATAHAVRSSYADLLD